MRKTEWVRAPRAKVYPSPALRTILCAPHAVQRPQSNRLFAFRIAAVFTLFGQRVAGPSCQDGKEHAVIHYEGRWATLRMTVLRLVHTSPGRPYVPASQSLSSLPGLPQPPRGAPATIDVLGTLLRQPEDVLRSRLETGPVS